MRPRQIPLPDRPLGHVGHVREHRLRLHDVVDRPGPHRRHGVVLAALAGHDHDRERLGIGAHLDPVPIGQPQIGDHQAGRRSLYRRLRLLQATHHRQLHGLFVFERPSNQLGVKLVILHEEDVPPPHLGSVGLRFPLQPKRARLLHHAVELLVVDGFDDVRVDVAVVRAHDIAVGGRRRQDDDRHAPQLRRRFDLFEHFQTVDQGQPEV